MHFTAVNSRVCQPGWKKGVENIIFPDNLGKVWSFRPAFLGTKQKGAWKIGIEF